MSQLSFHDAMFAHFSTAELEILVARARELAAVSDDSSLVQRRSVLNVKLNSEQYALFLDDLLAIHDDVNIAPVPCTPPFVRGIVNLRGRLVTVLDLSVILKGTPGHYHNKAKLLLLNAQQEQVALLVGETTEITSQTIDHLQSLPLELDHIQHALGILPDGVVLLDIGALVNDPALVVAIAGEQHS
jgi:purine-binding chemotaxis protein CheW